MGLCSRECRLLFQVSGPGGDEPYGVVVSLIWKGLAIIYATELLCNTQIRPVCMISECTSHSMRPMRSSLGVSKGGQRPRPQLAPSWQRHVAYGSCRVAKPTEAFLAPQHGLERPGSEGEQSSHRRVRGVPLTAQCAVGSKGSIEVPMREIRFTMLDI
jgi:hypothetical protein